jgi:VWFA-related protein
MKRVFFFLLIVCCFCRIVCAQTASTTPEPVQPVQDDNDVVKITTNLIQVDVTVTDSKGKIISDLKPEEIEVYENGKKQNITNFSFINAQTVQAEKETAEKPKDDPKDALTGPPVILKAGDVKRTIALVVDDLTLSFQSTYYVRQALKKFVDEQMQPNDLVAIIRTGSGMGSLQQFTSDKRQLYAAIEKIRWNPAGNGSVGVFAPIGNDPQPGDSDDQSADSLADAKEFREDLFATGTLGAVNYVVRGLRTLPGRKSIMLFSDGFRIRSKDGFGNRVLDSLRSLTELANRASVVIYTLDARGLQYTGLTAADDTLGMSFDQIEQQVAGRRDVLISGQEGLRYLSDATGGLAFINSNDLSYGINRDLNDQAGYYLVGYQPEDETFDPAKRKFNRLTVKVTRPGLKARYRSGFFNVKDEDAKPVNQTPQQQIFNALSSPFATGQIAIKLTPLLSLNEKKEAYINSFIHVKASDLKFTDQPDGWKKASFDIVVVAFGDNGMVADQLSRTENVRLRGPVWDTVQKEGFVYTVQFPIKKPGGYQMRIALRDTETSNIGSASQFIEVPNIRKNRMILSGIVLQQTDDKVSKDQVNRDNEAEMAAARQMTALRKFSPGSFLGYNLTAYSPQTDRNAGRPRLKTQVMLFHNGNLIYKGREYDSSDEIQTKPGETLLGGAIQLGDKIEPGDYILQVIVTDPSAKPKDQVKTQWIDFEVVK